MIPKHEQFIQRWAHRAGAIAAVLAACGLGSLVTVVYIGVNRPAEKPAPDIKGNITCWMDADGKQVKCFAPTGTFTCLKQ
jgi:hypothetical protein